MTHHWQGSCCIECEADASWCDDPPVLPLGITPRFLWVEARLKELDAAIVRYASRYLPVRREWIEERADHVTYLNNYYNNSGGTGIRSHIE